MGSIFSILQAATEELLRLNRLRKSVIERVSQTPGIPVPNPTPSYWTHPPSPIANHIPSNIPTQADVVIIGSGITALSVARTLLLESRNKPLKLLMLEARETCSGATGR